MQGQWKLVGGKWENEFPPPWNVVHPTCVACRAKVSGGTKVGFRLAYTASKGRDSVMGRGGGNGTGGSGREQRRAPTVDARARDATDASY